MDKNKMNTDNSEAGKFLGSIPKKELYTAPEGYFDGFATEMMDRIKSAPHLYAIEKKELVSQPEGYADQLHTKMMAAISTPKATQTKIVPMSVQLFRWTAVAATLAILFTIGYSVIGGNAQPDETAIHIAENPGMTHEDCQHYLENEINLDDAIAYYVSQPTTAEASPENSAELDYLMAEEDIEFENY